MRAKKSSKKGDWTRRKDEESPFNDSPQNPRKHNLLLVFNNREHPKNRFLNPYNHIIFEEFWSQCALVLMVASDPVLADYFWLHYLGIDCICNSRISRIGVPDGVKYRDSDRRWSPYASCCNLFWWNRSSSSIWKKGIFF